MKTSEALAKARDVIADPKHWTQDVYARDTTGDSVEPFSSSAVCFCALGALYRAQGVEGRWWYAERSLYDLPGYDALGRAAAEIAWDASVAGINDQGTHEHVMALYDKAIAQAIADGD